MANTARQDHRVKVEHDVSLGVCILLAAVFLVLAAAILPRVDCALGIAVACEEIRLAREASP